QGLMPDAVIDIDKSKNYLPKNLLGLANKTTLTAKEIADATYADLDLADELQIGAATTVKPISNASGTLLNRVNKDELVKFACIYGNEIGRRQRCAGLHYSKTVDELKAQKALNIFAGRFSGISENEVGN